MKGATLSDLKHEIAKKFQSTRPVKGATLGYWLTYEGSSSFNPRAP